MDERPLHAGRHRTGFLVDWDDPARVHRRIVLLTFPAHDLVLGIGELESRAAKLDGTVQHDVLMRMEHVTKEGLVGKDGPDRPGLVAHDQLEQPESGPACGAQSRRQDLTGDRRDVSGTERFDRKQLGAVFVAQWKSKQQIFDGRQPDALEIRRTARPDAFHVPQRRRKQVI